jgi:uncharacterized protein (TIGR03118 family)
MEVQMVKRAISSLCVVALAVFIPLAGLASGSGSALAQPRANDMQGNAYRLKKLVSDVPGWAAQVDPHLVNAWGLAAAPSSPWWVANNGTNTSTLYTGTGGPIPLVVRVGGAPTGEVFNGGTNFLIHHDGWSAPSVFLWATESGTIRGWNPGMTPIPSKQSYTVVNRSGKGASFKGLAIMLGPQGDLLYATDFINGHVDVFDGNFTQLEWPGAFVDPHIPAGWAPFGIQAIRNKVFVTFAKQDGGDEADGPGLGYVDMFSMHGRLLARVASRHELNAPWGMTWAPSNFGRFSGDLLVGNFGDGKIHAYGWGPHGFWLDGTVQRSDGDPIRIDGLWGLAFGNGAAAGPTNSLFFTAGPGGESHGLFGSIRAGD